MPKGGLPDYRRRKQPVLDDFLRASVDEAGGKHDPETGWYKVKHITGIANNAELKEVIRALHRSKRHVGVSVTATPIRQKNGGYTVEFAAVHRDFARAYVAARYGDNLPYNPHRRES